MKENRELKSNLVTVRLSDNDMEIINELCERTNRNVSDTILRSCKFGLGIGDIFNDSDENELRGKYRKQKVIHLRMSDSDKNMLDTSSRELGKPISKIVRASIRAYDRSLGGDF